ncbi:putative DD34D transposase [Trichonephila clavipes]|nr:putative DD34D transposase [Trichonephila clavipes]
MRDPISICEGLAKRNEIDPFLKRMVTGDEKWVTYYNIVQKRSWNGRNCLTEEVLCSIKTTPGHTPVVTRQNLWELGWEVLMHPPYSSDLAPSDYHLFLVLQNFQSDLKLGSRVDCEIDY